MKTTRYVYNFARGVKVKSGDTVLEFAKGEVFFLKKGKTRYKLWFEDQAEDSILVSHTTLDKLLDRCSVLDKSSNISIVHNAKVQNFPKLKLPKEAEGKYSSEKLRIKLFKKQDNLKYVQKVLVANLRSTVSKRADWENTKEILKKAQGTESIVKVSAEICLSAKPWDCMEIGYTFNPRIAGLSVFIEYSADNPNPKRMLTKKTIIDLHNVIEKIKKTLTKKFDFNWSDGEFPIWPRFSTADGTRTMYIKTWRFA
jgi:hypothetical protein